MADAVGRDGLGQAIGYMSMAASVGTLTGPLLGGVLYEKCGYYSVFGLAFGLIGLDILLRFLLIERKDAVKWLAPETRPLLSAQSEAYASTDLPQKGVLERMSFLVSSSRLLVALWGNFVVALFLSSFDSVLPLFVQGAFQWQQSGQGLIFIPLIVAHVFDPVTGYIIDRFPRSARFITGGAFFVLAPLLVLLKLVTENSLHDKTILCALLSGIGLCLSVTLPPLDVEIFNIVEEKEKQRPGAFGAGGATALAFGLTNMGFSAGNLVGPFFAGFIRQEAGWGTMSWALGSMAALSGIPILLFMGGWILEPVRSEDEGQDSSIVSNP
jgi:MFS family permease